MQEDAGPRTGNGTFFVYVVMVDHDTVLIVVLGELHMFLASVVDLDLCTVHDPVVVLRVDIVHAVVCLFVNGIGVLYGKGLIAEGLLESKDARRCLSVTLFFDDLRIFGNAVQSPAPAQAVPSQFHMNGLARFLPLHTLFFIALKGTVRSGPVLGRDDDQLLRFGQIRLQCRNEQQASK